MKSIIGGGGEMTSFFNAMYIIKKVLKYSFYLIRQRSLSPPGDTYLKGPLGSGFKTACTVVNLLRS